MITERSIGAELDRLPAHRHGSVRMSAAVEDDLGVDVHVETAFGADTERLGALASASEVVVGLAFTGLFFLLFREGYAAVGGAGLAMCVLGSFSSTFPVAPMSGRDIFDHSKLLWVILFAASTAIFCGWLFLM